MEAAHYGAGKPYNMNQGKRILSWGNTFYGQMQTASGAAWDDDGVSRAMNIDISSPQVATAGVGTVVNTTPMELHTPVNWSTSQVERSSDHMSVTVKTGISIPPPWVFPATSSSSSRAADRVWQVCRITSAIA